MRTKTKSNNGFKKAEQYEVTIRYLIVIMIKIHIINNQYSLVSPIAIDMTAFDYNTAAERLNVQQPFKTTQVTQ